MKIRLEVKRSSLQRWRTPELRFWKQHSPSSKSQPSPPILGHDRKGVTDGCKGTKRSRANHEGQNLGSVKD